MTTKTIEVLNPTAKATTAELEIAPRLDDLNGKVIGFLDNDKPNFGIFLSRVEELLCRDFKFAEIVHTDKGIVGSGAAAPLPKEHMEQLIAKCDLVVNGMCD